MSVQFDWAWCHVCQVLHYAGFAGPEKGPCPGSDSEHSQQASPHYVVEYDAGERAGVQQGWASCSKCRVLHYAGLADKGACQSGGQHEQIGSFAYAVPFDTTGGILEPGWASCTKCRSLYWADGASGGSCAAGGDHDRTGSFAYAVPRLPAEAAVRWVGLECIMRQESVDEIYGGLTVVPQDGVGVLTHKFPADRESWDMGEDGHRIVPVDVLLYSGAPKGLAVTLALVEGDDGAAVDKLKAFLAKAAAEAAAKAANTYVPGSGEVAKPVLEDIARWVLDLGSDLLGTNDDAYPPQTLSLTADNLTGSPFDTFVLTRGDDSHRLTHTHRMDTSATDEGGDRGAYAAYFFVQRAAPVPLWQREPAYRRPQYRLRQPRIPVFG